MAANPNLDTAFGWGTTVSSLALTSADMLLLASWTQAAIQEVEDDNHPNSAIIAFLQELKGVMSSVQTHFT